MSKMKDCRVPACRRERSKSSPLYRFVRRQHHAHNIVVSSLNRVVWSPRWLSSGRLRGGHTSMRGPLLHKGGKP
ncbi:hypothetical protein SEA_STEVIEBAY_67 [Arthrobacter phage StevieBAY]|uniref:Uncharacterized protein n=1 Tax=Arthrobacter phage StevieBAY TaxID=2725609 RepID=A0A6M3T570_9CAUD|nr:hypothetical protein SEA_STEVIEBAY_67 [Arthrobacter phage StevieBAY]